MEAPEVAHDIISRTIYTNQREENKKTPPKKAEFTFENTVLKSLE